ncbi:MAG: peptide ABC transporter substrate-binding protein [Clostridiaceae bacterium]|jgi:oligopeptide transport system substrate-binding protein|nr:peptide ABC transporter substrate-binding protein [Clostridiaceae bacterium]
MKKLLTILLMFVMIFTIAACAPKEGEPSKTEGPAPTSTPDQPDEPDEPDVPGDNEYPDPHDWKAYDDLIEFIKTTQDMEARLAAMHEAEDMLMATGAIVPIYHYNDNYMAKPGLEGFYVTPYAYKYFEKATYGDRDTLNLCIASEPQFIDPALNSAVDGAVMAVNSFSGLVTYNENMELIPDTAEKIEVSDDGMTYTFTMREGLKWSNGDDFDAHDFEYSLKRAADTETGADYRYMLDCIKGWPEDDTEDVENMAVKASEDGKTLTIELKAITAYFLDLCAFPTYFPVHEASVEGAPGHRDADGNIKDPAAWTQEGGYVSNGPFMNTGWDHNRSITFEKNPNFHRADNVKLQKLHFVLNDDDPVIYQMYTAGDLDFIDNVPPAEIKKLLEENNPEFYVVDNLGTYFVIFNVNSEMFDGMTVDQAAKVRWAVMYAIDREYIVDVVGQTGQTLANSFLPPMMLDGTGNEFKRNTDKYTYPDEASAGYYPYEQDLDKSRELLEEAGYEFGDDGKLLDSNPIHIDYLFNTHEAHAQIAQIIMDDLAQLGIEMTVNQMDWDTTLAERKAGNYDVARHGWIADFNDPINMLEMWTSSSGNNDAQFGK